VRYRARSERSLAAEGVAKGADKVMDELSFKDIRRTCETLLGSISVSWDLRSHVLSHGRIRVQDKYYDGRTPIKTWRYAGTTTKAVLHFSRVKRSELFLMYLLERSTEVTIVRVQNRRSQRRRLSIADAPTESAIELVRKDVVS
jgi:hypothetical protein